MFNLMPAISCLLIHMCMCLHVVAAGGSDDEGRDFGHQSR